MTNGAQLEGGEFKRNWLTPEPMVSSSATPDAVCGPKTDLPKHPAPVSLMSLLFFRLVPCSSHVSPASKPFHLLFHLPGSSLHQNHVWLLIVPLPRNVPSYLS